MAWAQRLAATRYPYPAAAVTLVKCLRVGVDLGFYGERNRIQVGPNLQSAFEHPDAIDKNIATELDNGRRKGPFTEIPFDNTFYSNPLGVVFKKGKSKPRVIHHLSWPRSAANSSVNASIFAFDSKLDAFDKALVVMRQLGANCLMSKIDIESAYRCIPVRPEDWPLLGFNGKNNTISISSCNSVSLQQLPSSNGTHQQLNTWLNTHVQSNTWFIMLTISCYSIWV